MLASSRGSGDAPAPAFPAAGCHTPRVALTRHVTRPRSFGGAHHRAPPRPARRPARRARARRRARPHLRHPRRARGRPRPRHRRPRRAVVARGRWCWPCPPRRRPSAWPTTWPPTSATTPSSCSPPGRRCPSSASAPGWRRWAGACGCCGASARPRARRLRWPRRAAGGGGRLGAGAGPAHRARTWPTSSRWSSTPGQQVDRDDLVASLVGAGYRREEMVEHRGEIAVRGSIVDVFPSTADRPAAHRPVGRRGRPPHRVLGGRPALHRPTCRAPPSSPAASCLPPPAVRERAERLVGLEPWGRDQWERLAQGLTFDGMESWLPWLTDREHVLLDVVGDDAQVLLCEPRRMRDRAADLLAEEADLASTLAVTWGATKARGDEHNFPRLHLDFDRLLSHSRRPGVAPHRRGRQPRHAPGRGLGVDAGGRRPLRPAHAARRSCRPTATASWSAPTARARPPGWATCWPARASGPRSSWPRSSGVRCSRR